jgi:hypothetical protein
MSLQRTSTSAFGLVAWLEQTQIHLPLKAIECRFEASGAAVDVQIDQIFHQSAGRPLDVTYSFPLPSKAAAYRCEMIVNGRTIRAKVMEQEAAREIARQKKAEGRRTALVEMERGNLFTLSLGNVQPDDIIVIRFAYVDELDAWKDELALQIPFNPGVRYVPGKPLLRLNSGKGRSRRYGSSPGRLTDLTAAHRSNAPGCRVAFALRKTRRMRRRPVQHFLAHSSHSCAPGGHHFPDFPAHRCCGSRP